ncbi:MAG: hypothetical protein KDI33_11550 [Halioglobus sp.]|nr:hypothetical protein [Halioglobus sp.]
MYYWLLAKTESPLLATLVSTLAYAALMLAIMLFSRLPTDTFRYLEF